MLRRLAPGAALTSMATLMLVGCSPAAAPASTPTPTHDALATELVRVRAAYDAYHRAVAAMNADRDPDAGRLQGVATPELAERDADELRGLLQAGEHAEGWPSVREFEVARPSAGYESAARVCFDLSTLEYVEESGAGAGTDLPPTRAALVHFAFDGRAGSLVVADLVPDESSAALC